MIEETEGPIAILYGIELKCEGPSKATDIQTALINAFGQSVV